MKEVVLLNDQAAQIMSSEKGIICLKFVGRAHKEINENKRKKRNKPFIPTFELKRLHKAFLRRKQEVPTQIKESFLF